MCEGEYYLVISLTSNDSSEEKKALISDKEDLRNSSKPSPPVIIRGMVMAKDNKNIFIILGLYINMD